MKRLFKFIRRIIFLVLLLIGIVIGYIVYDGYNLYKKVTAEESIQKKAELIMSKDDYLSFNEIPKDFSIALVSVEDHRFFEHPGFDIISIVRAMISNIQEKKLVEGGSSITQQLAKNMYFKFDKKFTRKIAELFVVRDLENMYDKKEILAMYINIVYFGEGYYGLNDAAYGYYEKEPANLTYDEITLLAGLPNAPSVFNPVQSEDLSKQRQKIVKDAIEKYKIEL